MEKGIGALIRANDRVKTGKKKKNGWFTTERS